MIGAKIAIALGFGIMAAGLIIGSRTSLNVSNLFIITWIGITGIGLGFAIPGSMDAALGDLSAERSGVGSSLVTALRQVGGTLGVAILGTLLSTSYRSKLDLSKLPSLAVTAINSSVTGGVTVAHKLKSAELLLSVKTAYVHGMEVLLLVCAGIALAAVVVALVFLPNRSVATGDDNAKVYDPKEHKTKQSLGARRGVRVAIQTQALRLFAEHGYIETTVKQIAEASDVSLSTFHEYFSNKEAVVLHDDYAPLIVRAFQDQPAELSTTHALHQALNRVFSELPAGQLAREQKKSELMHHVPELHGARIGEVARNINMFTKLIAKRPGHPANDATAHVMADSISGDIERIFSEGVR
jgi:AcrR family transcriptional regulator